MLMIEAVSKLFLVLDIGMGWEIADMPEIEAGPDLKLPEAE